MRSILSCRQIYVQIRSVNYLILMKSLCKSSVLSEVECISLPKEQRHVEQS